MARASETEIAGVRLTSPDRVLYREQGITKEELARYYESIGDWILPHLEGRPLSFVRCPRGEHEACFFQRRVDESFPRFVKRVRVRVEGEEEEATYAVVDSLPGVVYLAQIGVLELHTWGARRDRLDRPDRLVFDLDPDPAVAWKEVASAAREVRERLDSLGIRSYVKTTGGKGLHVVAPLVRRSGWEEVREFARAVAERMEADSPERYVTEAAKAERTGRVFIDYLRNGYSASAVAAYSTRAREGAPVSVPLSWDELDRGVDPARLTVRTVPGRLAKLPADPWADYHSDPQQITAATLRELGVR